MINYDELKMLAEKATPGPWWIDSHGMTMMSMRNLEVVFNHPCESVAVRNDGTGNLSHWRNDWDASYIAAANPDVVFALIAENEGLRKDAGRYRWLCDGNGYFMEEQGLCGHSNEKSEADRSIDEAMGSGDKS